MKHSRYFILLALLGFCGSLVAQSQYMRYWVGADVSKSIKKDWRVIGGMQARFNEYEIQPYNYFVQARVQYTPVKWYRVGVNYRYARWGAENEHRFDLDNYLRYSLEKEDFDVRLRLQRSFEPLGNSVTRYRVRFRYRHRFSKRLNVYGKAEYFYTQAYDYSDYNLQRYTVGCKFRVALKHFIDVFGRYESQQNVEWPEQRFVLGLVYNLKL